MKSQWRYEEPRYDNPIESVPVPIVAEGQSANPKFADGRVMPILLLDTSRRPDIDNLIKLHQHLPPGDVKSQWGKYPDRDDKVLLLLQYSKPARCVLLLEFDMQTQGAAVDTIVRVQGVYLQAGRPGGAISTTTEKESAMVEVPSQTFQPDWDRLFHRAMEKYWRSQGFSKREAKQIARKHIADWRSGAQAFRMTYPDP